MQPDRAITVVRPAASQDLNALVAIDALCFSTGIAYPRAEMAALLHSSSVLTLVAESSTAIAGFAALGIYPAPLPASPSRRGAQPAQSSAAIHGELITIDVLPQFRRRRVGWQLHRALEDWLRAGSGTHIELHVAVDNAGAIRFYRQLGYSVMERVPRYYMAALDAWRMEKAL